MLKSFKSLAEMQKAFPDENACINHFRVLRWPDAAKITCPWCGVIGAHSILGNNTHKCHDCRKKFSVRKDTIFEDSKIALRTWFIAIFLMTSHKKGISSCQLAKDIGVTQKTAWFMLHRIRNAAMTKEFNAPLRGTVEVDDSFVGPKPHFQHVSKRALNYGSKNKKVIFGMVQRGGDLRLTHVQNRQLTTLIPLVTANVVRGSRIHSDESSNYSWMSSAYAHDFVTHKFGEYVRGDVTTNTIEGVFSHFKRTVVGTYHKISDEHLDRYLQMFAFRWNSRTRGKGKRKIVVREDARVNDLLRATKGRRITYKTLIS